MKETKSEEEIKTLKEKRKEEAKKLKQERKKEFAEAEKRRKRQSEAAEETAIKLGKKKNTFNPYYLMFGVSSIIQQIVGNKDLANSGKDKP